MSLTQLKREIERSAHELFNQYGLAGWTFMWNRNKARLGVCKYSHKRIELSVYGLDDVKQLQDTLLHEIAHAIVGRKQHHNHVWRRKAVEIGCSGQRCGKMLNVPYKWIGTCIACKDTVKRHRLIKRPQSCPKHGSPMFDARHLIVWTSTP